LFELKQGARERAILIGMSRNGAGRWETEDHLEELALLADTAGAVVVKQLIQEKERIDPAFFIGRGKANEVSGFAQDVEADLLVFDDDLSPAQARNWEKLSGIKILDRSGLILDIFARRAKTSEARTQVELAQLNYLLPRLTRQWTHLSRQVGGIGTRGPGETQLEVDRRLIRKRISTLKRDLETIKNHRRVRRVRRDNLFKAALVGYTNAGKSTLINTLTGSDVFVEDRLFATLDATIRKFSFPDASELLLIDTVGFIRKLPHHLVASFMSTLEEAAVADLLLHVVDINHSLFREHITVVNEVLSQLGISNKPTVFVFNKIDLLEETVLIDRLKHEFSNCLFVSASKGLFLNDLQEEIYRASRHGLVTMIIDLDLSDAQLVAKIHDLSNVLDCTYGDTHVTMRIEATRDKGERIKRFVDNSAGKRTKWVSSETIESTGGIGA
jgi:GTP-binding protein HflX